MTLHCRPFAQDPDVELVTALLLAGRDAESVYRYPTIWRLRQLLTSRLWDPDHDAHVWVDDADGQIVAFAMLWRRRREQSGSGLEYLRRAERVGASLDTEVLTWAKTRTRKLSEDRRQLFRIDALATNTQTAWIASLERAGFVRYPDGYNPYYALSLSAREAQVNSPSGFTIRPLVRLELDAYERIFGFTSIGRDHRDELMRSPEYAHFVAVSPDGQLAGYCECSYSRAEWDRSGRRVGWIDYVGVDDAYLRRGVGRALMCAGFERMRAWGAETAMLVTASSNVAARALYEGLGMREREQEHAWIWQDSKH